MSVGFHIHHPCRSLSLTHPPTGEAHARSLKPGGESWMIYQEASAAGGGGGGGKKKKQQKQNEQQQERASHGRVGGGKNN